MMKFTNNDWGQHDIIKNIKTLTKRGTNTIYTVILMKFHVNVCQK